MKLEVAIVHVRIVRISILIALAIRLENVFILMYLTLHVEVIVKSLIPHKVIL